MPLRCRLLSLASALLAVYSNGAHADVPGHAQFDIQTLQARGYSADLAAFFSQAPRFLPGTHTVTVNVNASRNYRIDALFDSNGELCFNAALLATLGLRRVPLSTGCIDIAATWPAIDVALFPGQFRVELTIPEDAFDPALREGAFQRGGTGALLNYDLFMQRIDSPSNGMNYLQATIEPGVNFANWSIRNRGVFTQYQGQTTYQQQEAYAQRPIGALNALMQVGRVSTFGESFGGLPVLGAQIGTDGAQTGADQLVVPIQGIASSRATIEISQRGRVIYRTVVPPGPFTLSSIPGLTGGADIDVEVLEESGQRRRFNVPARAAGAIRQPTAWMFGIGRYSNPAASPGDGSRAPLLATGEYAYNPIDRLRLTVSGLFAVGYQNLAAQSALAATDFAWASGAIRYARTKDFGQGTELSLQGSSTLGPNLSGSLSWLSRTSRYADSFGAFDSVHQLADSARVRHSAGASVTWAHPRWGALSYVVNHNTYYNDNVNGGFSHTLNLGRQIGRANVSASLQASPNGNFGIYANFSMPLGKGTLRQSVIRTSRNDVTTSASYDGQLGRGNTYSLGISGDANDQRFSASANMNTAYARVGAGVSQTTGNTRSAYLSATGALVYADGLVGTAASRVGDTFAIVQVPGRAGLRVTAPSSTSITNMAGTAVIPSIPPYTKVEVRVDTQSLPLNTRLETTTVDLSLTRGSVAAHRIKAAEVRHLLLAVRDADGQPVPLGTTVYDDEGGVMGTIVGEGNFMLVNDDIGKTLRLGGANPCQVSYSAPERFDPHNAYEEAQATCGDV